MILKLLRKVALVESCLVAVAIFFDAMEKKKKPIFQEVLSIPC